MPDGALLVVTKQLEQPKQIWNLRRIAAWDTSRPREDALDVDVGPNDELLAWSLQEDRQDRNAQLMMDPGGNYLVVRYHKEGAKQSVLNIVDLHGFKLLRRVTVADPLLAEGDMGFSPSGAFVVSGPQERANQYAVETLSLPGLMPETMCSYETERKRNPGQAADEACRPELAPLGFSSLADVRKNLNFFGMWGWSADHSGNIPPQSPWGCQSESFSRDLKYKLVDCDESRVQVTFFFWYRGFRVFRPGDGAQVMDLKVPHNPQFSGVLAMSRGVTYVVLLRNGAELEGYRVPA